MRLDNPYKQKVLQDPDIIYEKEQYFKNKNCWNAYFWNTQDIILEIGSGMGNYFSYMLKKNPQKNYIALELRLKRLFTTAQKAREASKEEKNFVVLSAYGQDIWDIFWKEEISETYIYFPDPFANKKKQFKHRLISQTFLEDLYIITKVWGTMHFKTDHRAYFEDVLNLVKAQKSWKCSFFTRDYKNSEIYNHDAITEFEWLFRWEQEDFYYLILEK